LLRPAEKKGKGGKTGRERTIWSLRREREVNGERRNRDMKRSRPHHYVGGGDAGPYGDERGLSVLSCLKRGEGLGCRRKRRGGKNTRKKKVLNIRGEKRGHDAN